jgi:integrase
MNKKVFSEESFSNNNPSLARNKTDFQVVQMAPDPRNKKERIDPLRKEQLYASWKRRNKDGIPNLSKSNSDIILRYLTDMEKGLYTAKKSRKGARSKARLLALAYHLKKIAGLIEDKYNINLIELSSRKQIHSFFDEFRKGNIKTKKGEPYQSADDFIRDFICFWNWYVRVIDEENELIDEENQRIEIKNKNLSKGKREPLKEKKYVIDLVKYLARQPKVNTFVHASYKELQAALPHMSEDNQTIALFMFDSIVRSPLEFSNVYVEDVTFYDDFTELNVRDEIAKTFGRKFELILCGEKLKEYIKRHDLKPGDQLFKSYNHSVFNKELQKAYLTAHGNKMTQAGKPFSEITGYSLRHSGACYLRFDLEVDTDKIRLRGGWTDMRILDYYTKVLGYEGRISKSKISKTSESEVILHLVEQHNKEKEELKKSHTEIVVELKKENSEGIAELKRDHAERIEELKQIILTHTAPNMRVTQNA